MWVEVTTLRITVGVLARSPFVIQSNLQFLVSSGDSKVLAAPHLSARWDEPAPLVIGENLPVRYFAPAAGSSTAWPRSPITVNLILGAEQVPLRRDETGTVRIGPTRVTLDTLVSEFHAGATPEQIGQDYPSLALADIYGAISFYLRHRDEVQDYLAARQVEAKQLREESERRHDPTGIRERLLARRSQNLA